MRLGQFARKYNIAIKDITSYLDGVGASLNNPHPNSGLSDETEALLMEQFELDLEEVPEQVEEKPEIGKIEEIVALEEVVEVEEIEKIEVKEEVIAKEEVEEALEAIIEEKPITEFVDEIEEEVVEELIVEEADLEAPEESIEPVFEPIKEVPSDILPKRIEEKINEEEVMETDKFLALLESDDPSVDLSKITLIKASKKKLEGLKVVGKIDLPEPKIKEPNAKEEVVEAEEKVKPEFNENITQEEIENELRKEKRRLYREKQESRRLIAKEKQADFKVRQEKRKLEKEIEQKRAKKEAHYKQKLAPNKPTKVNQKTKKQKQELVETIKLEDQPNSILGKFWKWLNT
jgi:hypothetical protein